MKVICWNVQGAKKVQVLEEVNFLKRLHNPDIIFLLETLTNDLNSKRIIQRMGFQNSDFVLPINHSGGIWVLWNNDRLHAAVLSKESQAIHMLVHDPICNKNSIVSGMYGPAQEKDKDAFLDHLLHLHSVLTYLG